MSLRLFNRGVTTSAYHGSGTSGKPSSSTTGYAPGTVFTTWNGGDTISNSSTTLQNIHFTNAHPYYTVVGTNLTIRNCLFDVGILFDRCDGLLLEDTRIAFNGASLTSVLGATIRRCDIEGGGGDLLHITADQPGRPQCTNIVIEDSILHGPKPGPTDHTDGLQLRGVDGFTMTNTVVDVGPWVSDNDLPLNAAFFLENGNGGNENIEVEGCWFNGGAICLRYFGVTGTFSINNCKVGPDWNDGIYEGDVIPTQSGNITEANGQPVSFLIA